MCHVILKTLQTPISHVATMIRVSATLIPAQATDQVQIQRRINRKSNSCNLRQTKKIVLLILFLSKHTFKNISKPSRTI